MRARVLIILARDSWYSTKWSADYREKGQDRQGYYQESNIDGLERYSRLRCFSKDELRQPDVMRIMRNKEADDPTPPHCRLDRRLALLATPASVTTDSDSVSVICQSTGCTVNFLAGNRLAETSMQHEDLPRWKEIVKAAQQLINGFIVDKTPMRSP